MDLFPIHLLFIVVLMNRYILGPFLRRLKGKRFERVDDTYQPRVAVVIPLFNEGRGIVDTINALLAQDYPSELLQIIIVDDCSQDDSFAWALKAAEGHRNVVVTRNPENMGKRKGINRGVRTAEDAEIIVSVDSDVIVDRRAVRELIRRFVEPNIAAVGGRTYVTNRHQNWLTKMIEIKFHFAQQWLKDLERSFRQVMCLSGCLTAYRRHVLLELEPILEARAIAGVPIKYGEDRFLTRQIIKHHYETVYTLDSFCFTAAPANLAGYFAQQLRWRRSNLVDLLSGLSHAWRLHPVITIHYVSQLALLLSYPVVIVANVINGEFWDILAFHFLIIGLLGFIYRLETRHLPADRRVSGASFLPMALLMPVTYALFTPLALLTLDSGSWETRGSPKAAPTLSPSPQGVSSTHAGEGTQS
ncbi:glycosyl transferase family 2 [Corallococcus sp. H22C18031201]|uniref:glycosyltransferase n=1 Tax=Citreicoccus inhibens TaxID=2849499 RepID=UPI000E75BDEE|nr:glycosyltransferase [Citreicoccus inhibens]MBU8897483.1 glycosyltransferase [Citreicoccus inhibens]RJS16744.1 glycosyl transferase family 2 [Corallococcus sp. H22C18031201]